MVTVEGGEDRPVAFDVPSTGWAAATVELSSTGWKGEAFGIARFGEDEDIPRLVARGGRFRVVRTTSATRPGRGVRTGDRAVLSLRQRTSQADRQWYLWKRLAERLGEGVRPASVLVLGARLSEPAVKHIEEPIEPPPYLARVRRDAGTPVGLKALPGVGEREALSPVLADLAEALETFAGQAPAELVVWVVACDDARRATPLGTFRKAAEFLLSRARRWGAGRLVVMFVPEPAVPAERRALYSEELRRAAGAYRGSFAQLDELVEVRFWAAEGPAGPQRALGRYPNARGHAALAEAILGRIRP